ncbi:MAG: hypothetical protein COA38_06285 [Fluviicola sp.]|nr:MAG: hypothetical protein COA38_06285 [Fluviicola sp.]
MKPFILKFKLTVILFLLTVVNVQAQVPKNLVLVEKFSGVNCGACPEAVHQIHDLIDNQNAQIAVISYQTGYYSIPEYNNSDSQGRHTYYASDITGYPTTIFGGEHIPIFNNSQQYLDHYNNEMAELSPVSLTLSFTDNGNGNISLNSTITEESAAGSNLKLMIAITETNIDQNWLTESVLYDVNRKMLANYNGTSFDFMSSSSVIISESFTMDPSWDRDYLSAVVFVQNSVTKEVLQAAKISLADNSYTNDAMVDRIYFDTDKYCGESMSPMIRIRNSGTAILQSATIDYSIAGASNSFNWTGNLASFEQEDIQLSQITFTSAPAVTLEATISNPNGLTDEDLSNDMISQLFTHSVIIGSTPSLEVKTDGFAPFYTEWKIIDDQGNIIDQAGTSDWQEFTLYNYDFNLADGCYEFIISDATGNGFVDWTTGSGQSNSGEENGYFIFYDAAGNIISEDVDFGYELKVPFKVGQTNGIENQELLTRTKIYPNPSTGTVIIEHFNESTFTVLITDPNGKVVAAPNKSFAGTAQINLEGLNPGFYFVRITDSLSNTTSPLLIQ